MGLFGFGKKKETHVDPVCGMTVDPASAVGSVAHGGRTYYFCSANCMGTFRQDPAKFAR